MNPSPARFFALSLLAACTAVRGPAAPGGDIPPGWRQKALHLELAEGEHANVLRTGWLSLKKFGDGDPPRDVPVLRLRMPDGAAWDRGPTRHEYAVRRVKVVGCQSGQIWVPPSQSQRTPGCQWVRFEWTLPPWDSLARPGDAIPAVVVCDNETTHWTTKPFILRCGGKGRHAACTQCFSLVAVSAANARFSTPPARPTPAAAPHAPSAAPPEREHSPLDVHLQHATPIYSPDAPPYANGIASDPVGTLAPGTPVHILKRLPPFCLLIRYETPEGELRQAAVFASDIPGDLLSETGDSP